MMEGVLVLSTSRGRYALDFATGPQLTTGDRIAIRLAGNWIAGTVEHSRRLYAVEDGSAPRPRACWCCGRPITVDCVTGLSCGCRFRKCPVCRRCVKHCMCGKEGMS